MQKRRNKTTSADYKNAETRLQAKKAKTIFLDFCSECKF